MINNSTRLSRGQVGLTVLLIVVVLVTVGVAVAGRSVSELKISRMEEESTRSLNLAESAIEKALDMTGSIPPSVIINSQTVNLTTNNEYQVNEELYSGHVVDVVLEGKNSTGADVVPGGNLPAIKITWDSGTCPNVAAIEVTIIKNNGDTRRITADKCNPSNPRTPVNNFDSPIVPSTTETVVSLNSNPVPDKLVRIKGFYQQTQVAVVGEGGELPVQRVEVTAKAPIGADNTTRAVTVSKGTGSLPSIFDYVVFSGNTLVKN